MTEKNDNSKLKGYLDGVLSVSETKFNYAQKADSNRIRWGNLIVKCVKAYGELIKNEELEDLRLEIDQIKEELKNKRDNS